jgi:hypothetical protein
MPLLPSEREALVAELARRQGKQAAPMAPAIAPETEEAFLADLHPKQLAFVQDGARRLLACTGRRGGKTVALLYLTMRAIRRYPGATIPYIGLSREQCRKNFWKPLVQLNARYGLGLEFNRQKYIATAPNGAEVNLIGADNESEIDKLRGDKFPLVMIDEAGSFGSHLEELVEDALDAALGDYDGQIVMTSSPPVVPAGFFYDAVTGVRAGWSTHTWTVEDNSKFPQWTGQPDWQARAKAYLVRKAAQFGPESPKFLREYLGQLTYDQTALYYKFAQERNTFTELPKKDWRYGLGLDVGYEDNTAFVVIAACPRTQKMYVVETFAKPKMLDEEIAAKIRELDAKYSLIKRVADFSQKQFVMGLNVKYQCRLMAAEKQDKLAQIELLNSDFLTGRILVNAREREFCKELATVCWNKDHDGPQETRHLGHHADRHDALRYIWRAMLPYRGRQERDDTPPDPTGDARLVAEEAARVAKLEHGARNRTLSLEALYGAEDDVAF